MIKLTLSVIIIAIVVAGMVTVMGALIRHWNKKTIMDKSVFRWNLMLLLVGLLILIDKIGHLLNY